jgi:hypothetical protein
VLRITYQSNDTDHQVLSLAQASAHLIIIIAQTQTDDKHPLGLRQLKRLNERTSQTITYFAAALNCRSP